MLRRIFAILEDARYPLLSFCSVGIELHFGICKRFGPLPQVQESVELSIESIYTHDSYDASTHWTFP